MAEATSSDGTTIGFLTSGEGPSAVLVHGTSSDKSGWMMAGSHLRGDLMLHAMDRRGRGRSGDAEPYRPEQESDDIAAVVDAVAVDGPVHVVAHSWGAICALGAAGRSDAIRSLVLYEPPLTAAEHVDLVALADRCEQQVAAGNRLAAVTTFFAAIDHERELALLAGIPAAQEQMLRDAHTIGREVRGARSRQLDHFDLASVQVPVLVLAGSDSQPMFTDAAERLAAALPDAELVTIPGQRHLAQVFAPERFAEAVLAFTGSR